jgi:hypothetical protein
VRTRKRIATPQQASASVSSQVSTRRQAGRVKRKKLSDRPKIGSVGTRPSAFGAYQKRLSVGHSAARVKPVMSAMTIETISEIMRSAGATDNVIWRPAITMA